MKFPQSLLLVPVLAAASVPAYGVVNVSGDFATVNAASIAITEPITFTVTDDASAIRGIVFDEWLSADQEHSVVSVEHLTYRIGAGNDVVTTGTIFVDNLTRSESDMTADDGFFYFDRINVPIGETITFVAITVRNTNTSSSMNTTLNGLVFSGNAFLRDNEGNALSALTPVPEPATYAALAGALVLGIAILRRRKTR